MEATRHGVNGEIVHISVMEQLGDIDHVMILHPVMAVKIAAF